jgi:hypothetical protein
MSKRCQPHLAAMGKLRTTLDGTKIRDVPYDRPLASYRGGRAWLGRTTSARIENTARAASRAIERLNDWTRRKYRSLRKRLLSKLSRIPSHNPHLCPPSHTRAHDIITTLFLCAMLTRPLPLLTNLRLIPSIQGRAMGTHHPAKEIYFSQFEVSSQVLHLIPPLIAQLPLPSPLRQKKPFN